MPGWKSSLQPDIRSWHYVKWLTVNWPSFKTISYKHTKIYLFIFIFVTHISKLFLWTIYKTPLQSRYLDCKIKFILVQPKIPCYKMQCNLHQELKSYLPSKWKIWIKCPTLWNVLTFKCEPKCVVYVYNTLYV